VAGGRKHSVVQQEGKLLREWRGSREVGLANAPRIVTLQRCCGGHLWHPHLRKCAQYIAAGKRDDVTCDTSPPDKARVIPDAVI
jgi:hypothetical protein